MWKWIGLLLILLEPLFETLKPYMKHWFWAAAGSAALFIIRVIDKRRQQKQEKIILAIAEKVGVQWDGRTKTSKSVDLMNLRKLFSYSQAAFRRVQRRKNMNQQINIITIIVAVLGAVKIVLQAFGIDVVTDEQINQIANGIASIVTIFGVVMSHRKPKQPEQPFDMPTNNQHPFDASKSS